MQPVIHDTHTQEQGPGNKTVGHHLHDAAIDPGHRPLEIATGRIVNAPDDKEAEGDKPHVGNGGIGDQLFHILLY